MSRTLKAPSAPTRRHGRLLGEVGVRRLFILPVAAFLAIFGIFPIAQLVRMSLSAVSASTLNQAWRFVGLQNFRQDAASGDLLVSFERTLIFVAVITVIGMVGGLAAAMALRSSGRVSGFLLGLMVFVWALPPVVNGSVWKFLLNDNGLFNEIALALGLHSPIPFLYNQHAALYSVAFVNSWAVIPFNALVFRASLLNIPDDMFEAAELDGAGPWQQFRHLMLPSLRPTTLVLLVLTVVYAFRSFDFIYVMTYGGPGNATNTLPFLGYLQAFVSYNFGMGSATAVLTVVLVLGMAVVYARSIRKEEAGS